MNRWRAEYDDGIWRFYRDGMELGLYEKGDVVVDALNVAESRIAELEEKHKVAFGLVRKLRMYCFNANWEYSDPEEADEFDEFDAEVCEYLSEWKEREE